MDILIIDDDPLVRVATLQMVEDADHYAESAADGKSALATLREARFDLVLLDLQLGRENGLELLPQILKKYPATSVVVVTGHASIPTAVEALRLGAMDFLEKPFTAELLGVMLQKARQRRNLTSQVEQLTERVSLEHPGAHYESQCPTMQTALEVLFRAADTDASILILGESGTGKTMVAQEVHRRSARAEKPLVTVNCPNLSRELMESDLFGHVRGAFTGALRDTTGKVAAAEGGTLFLDEVGELPQETQARLLRLLNDRVYERVGETAPRQADVRIIAATNRDLQEAVAEKTFREDLFFRLNVITVELPPLRERPGDIPGLIETYRKFFASRYKRPAQECSASAMEALSRHSWPGNLRELRNAIERAVILGSEKVITAQDLSFSESTSAVLQSAAPTAGDAISLEALTNAHIQRTIDQTSSFADAARILEIDEATLYRWRKKNRPTD